MIKLIVNDNCLFPYVCRRPRRSRPTGTKNKPTSLDLRSSFVATRQSANKFAFALAAPKLAGMQEKPYIDAGDPRVK